MVRKFKGNRNLEKIISDAKEKGFEVDQEDFDKGGDWIWFRDMDNRMVQVVFNTFNGRFFVYTPLKTEPTATERSVEFEGVSWYDELLELFYEPLDGESNV